VIEALLAHVDDLEDVRSADAAFQDIREGRLALTSLDEVERELGLAS
jgi:predicted DNA-binding protein